jgi:hypothetical protein
MIDTPLATAWLRQEVSSSMYKQFAFEGDIHTSLECVPLTIRRKLDLADIKLSLAGWQQLSRAERLCLCHLPVELPEELAIYREVLLAFCQRANVRWHTLSDPVASARAWNADKVPPPLREWVRRLNAGLDDQAWSRLDEESRYALLKLTDPKRTPEKLVAALIELGLLGGTVPVLEPSDVICGSVVKAG